MPPLTPTTNTLLRTCARHQSPAIRGPASVIQRRRKADVIQRATAGEYQPTSSFDSPFRGGEGSSTTKIPSFKNYMAKGGETSNKVFSYFMVGTLGALTAAGAKATVQGGQVQSICKVAMGLIALQGIDGLRVEKLTLASLDFLVNMSASADILAQAKVEVDLSTIPLGKNVRQFNPSWLKSHIDLVAQVIIKWRGKPVFIRHRTEDEIKEAENTKWEKLRDPQPDSDRVQKPEWLIMLGAFIPVQFSFVGVGTWSS